MMNLYSEPGSKVIFAYPENGWPDDKWNNGRCGLILGRTYTVDHMEVHRSNSYVYLREFPGISFNPVNFEMATDNKTDELLNQIRDGLSEIHQYTHCIAKAGPLSTKTLDEAWGKFMKISAMAIKTLSLLSKK